VFHLGQAVGVVILGAGHQALNMIADKLDSTTTRITPGGPTRTPWRSRFDAAAGVCGSG
jgi:hypothetical protein